MRIAKMSINIFRTKIVITTTTTIIITIIIER